MTATIIPFARPTPKQRQRYEACVHLGCRKAWSFQGREGGLCMEHAIPLIDELRPEDRRRLEAMLG